MFKDNCTLFYSSRHVMQLFEYRRSYLKERVLKDTNFTWAMPGSIEGHPEVTAFLRGNEETMVYKGGFKTIFEARRFADNNGLQNGYSLAMVASGSGQKAQVTIAKTKEYYESQMKPLKEDKTELRAIEKILKDNNK